MRKKMRIRSYSKVLVVMLVMVLVVVVGLTGCDSDGGEGVRVDRATVTGDLRFLPEEGEDLYNTSGLVVLSENGTEIERQFVEYDEDDTSFHFKELGSGNYKITVYDLNSKTGVVNVQLKESEDLVLDDPIVLEGIDSERAIENILFLNPDEDVLADRNIRLSIASAINREELKNNIHDGLGNEYDANISKRLLTPTRAGYEDLDLNIEYSVENAHKFREKSDFESEVEIGINVNDQTEYRIITAEEIEKQFEELDQLDIKINSQVVDWETYIELESITALALTGYSPISMINFFVTQTNLNEKVIDGQSVDDLIAYAQLNQDDVDKVMEYLLPIEELLINEAYVISLVYLYEN